ncbi:MAG: hypothetical protein JSW39_08390 [Desulfobacterales bacterium]|nr:MAG: hypothetical protein JSW39_08390 [Desulfobacterales bacterium]
MGGNLAKVLVAILSIFLVAGISNGVLAGKSATITGTVNQESQIEDDSGEIYEVADTEKGDEVMRLFGQRVRVHGSLMEDEGMKIISVSSYEVIKE